MATRFDVSRETVHQTLHVAVTEVEELALPHCLKGVGGTPIATARTAPRRRSCGGRTTGCARPGQPCTNGTRSHGFLSDVILVGHSTGGGEVARYIGRHGTARVAEAVLLGAVPPLMLKTDANPEGTPIDAFDGIRAGVAADRSQFYEELSAPFYGANRPGSTVSQGKRDEFWLQSMQAGLKAAYDCIKQFSESDSTDDLARFDVPTLVAHGDDDQIVPIAAAALKTAQLVKDATLKVYPGAPHGLVGEFEQAFNADLLGFIRD